MNKDWKTKWTEALRSGEYEQAEGRLHVKPAGDVVGGHCCLGVLTDVYCKETGRTWEEVLGDRSVHTVAYLPYEVSTAVEFTDGELDLHGTDGVDVVICPEADELKGALDHSTASAVNDNYKRGHTGHGSFNDIADAIEENL